MDEEKSIAAETLRLEQADRREKDCRSHDTEDCIPFDGARWREVCLSQDDCPQDRCEEGDDAARRGRHEPYLIDQAVRPGRNEAVPA